MKITVGIPAYNEEKNIAKIIVKLKKIADKIIVCNDGSTDLTSEIAENLGAIVINHTKNRGYGSGIKSILEKSKEIGSEVLVTFDGDGQTLTLVWTGSNGWAVFSGAQNTSGTDVSANSPAVST